MKKTKRFIIIMAAAAVLLASAQIMFPRSTESVVGYSMEAPRCGILVALNEASDSYAIELDKVQMNAVREMLSSVSLCRTFAKGNVIHHKDGFGWYSIAFSDEEGQMFHPTMQVDSNGDVFIECVKYKIVDEAKKIELMELLGTICGR